jgi:tRNA isopentenyl-2-thiomethyl-A-37 hydroxylase MiaE
MTPLGRAPLLLRGLEPQQVINADVLVGRIRNSHCERAAWLSVADDDLADVASGGLDPESCHRVREGRLSDLVFVEVGFQRVGHAP